MALIINEYNEIKFCPNPTFRQENYIKLSLSRLWFIDEWNSNWIVDYSNNLRLSKSKIIRCKNDTRSKSSQSINLSQFNLDYQPSKFSQMKISKLLITRILAYPFNFYIFPFTQATDVMKFSFHAGTMNFLTKNKFNFNKLFYEGIPFANR